MTESFFNIVTDVSPFAHRFLQERLYLDEEHLIQIREERTNYFTLAFQKVYIIVGACDLQNPEMKINNTYRSNSVESNF